MLHGKFQKTKDVTDIAKLTDTVDAIAVADLDNMTYEPTTELGSDQWFSALMKYACGIHINKEEAARLVILIYNAVQHHVSAKAVDPAIVNVVASLQTQGKMIIALTARGKDIIEPTLRQLEEIKVDFSQSKIKPDDMVLLGAIKNYPIYFHKGIIFCSGQDKGDCLNLFLDKIMRPIQKFPRKIVMADDKDDNLAYVQNKVHPRGIHFEGLHYTVLEDKVKKFKMESTTEELTKLKDKFLPEVVKAIHDLKLIPASSSSSSSAATSSTSIAKTLYRENTLQALSKHGMKPIVYNAKEYRMLTHDLAVTPEMAISCQGSARETILLDCKSEKLNNIFKDFLNYLDLLSQSEELTQEYHEGEEIVSKEKQPITAPDPSDINTLKGLTSYVQTKLPARVKNDELQNMITQEFKAADAPVPIEWFFDKNTGSCRHQALAGLYLLMKLIELYAEQNGKSYSDSQSQLYRFRTILKPLSASTQAAKHSVIIYETANGTRFLIDPTRTNGLVHDFKTELTHEYRPYDTKGFIAEIEQTYGKLKQATANAAAAQVSTAVSSSAAMDVDEKSKPPAKKLKTSK